MFPKFHLPREGVEFPSGLGGEGMETLEEGLKGSGRGNAFAGSFARIPFPGAVQFAEEFGVKSFRTIQGLIKKMQDLHASPIELIRSGTATDTRKTSPSCRSCSSARVNWWQCI